MNHADIEILDDKNVFGPGETVKGKAVWQVEKSPETAFLRLFWYTKGKGTEDVEVVSEISFDFPRLKESRPFDMTLPESPYSFSGKLVSLIWAFELVVDGAEAVRKAIILSPYGLEIDLLQTTGDALDNEIPA